MSAIKKAISIVGSQSGLAQKLDITPQAVQQWVASGCVPVRRAIAIESLTGGQVTRHELRPDIYPEEVAV